LPLLSKAGIKQVRLDHAITARLELIMFVGSNGANLSFPQALGINDSGDSCKASAAAAALCSKNSWLVGFVNSVPYITIAFMYAIHVPILRA
jgi:hypothetical protein